MLSNACNMPSATKRKQQHLPRRTAAIAAAEAKTTTATHLVIFISLLLLLLPTTVLAEDAALSSSSSSLLAASSPHVAALAAPGSGGLSASPAGGSSILEKFTPNCSAVAHLFQARHIDAADIPQKPSNERVLRYCESPSMGTCCTYNMETRLAMQSRQQLETHTKDQINKMSSLLGSKATKFNEIFRTLLRESKTEFHTMFTRTYGVIYQQHSYVFSDLFNELENYFARGRVDLLDVMDKFFSTLYQKMFTVLNGQFDFDEKYMRCVIEHMKELKPFGDVPDKLSVQIKRSFVATRTYGQALATAAEVSKKILSIRLNADCTGALTKLQHCGACKGYTEKPCTNYCVNVIKGCLHYLHEFDAEWENFALAMDKLAERMLGSFNIVMVVEPINIKISEAIMNFQDSGQDITSRVFQGCGRPPLRRAKRAVSPKLLLSAGAVAVQEPRVESALEADILDIDAALDESIVLRERRSADPGSQEQQPEGGNGNGNNRRQQGRRKQQQPQQQQQQQQQRRKQQNNNRDNDNDREPILDKIVRDIRQRVKDYKKFWSNLPHSLCSNDDIAASSDADGMCWNGHTIDRYMHSVTTELGTNPEFSGNPASTRQTAQISTQLFHLKNAINHLRNAHNGQDVDWSEQEEPYLGSGGGSGSGSEDDEDDDEGSGLGPFEPSHKPDTEKPVGRDDDDDEDDDDEDVHRGGAGGGAGGPVTTYTSRPNVDHDTNPLDHDTHITHDHNELNRSEDNADLDEGNDADDATRSSAPEKMTLRRALFVYLLPLYMAWFGGGVCAELL
ncbi:glypican-6 [Scaptodrosophila lebanonensis]|uniref:Glypican-6 n=1 Tax=Drosophila lebanonensis TaxID=7225 RepID=A0A6J2UCW4_DROLE|nr:glypican-6 [Scaptodrosophila lebanonensis]